MDLHFNLIVVTDQYAKAADGLDELLKPKGNEEACSTSLKAIVPLLQEISELLGQIEEAVSDSTNPSTAEDGSALYASLTQVVGICKKLVTGLNRKLQDVRHSRETSQESASIFNDEEVSQLSQHLRTQTTILKLLLAACSNNVPDEIEMLLRSRRYTRLYDALSQTAVSFAGYGESARRESTVRRKPVPTSPIPPTELPSSPVSRTSIGIEHIASQQAVTPSRSIDHDTGPTMLDSQEPISSAPEPATCVNRANSAAAPQRTYLEYRNEQGLLPTLAITSESLETSRSLASAESSSVEQDVLPWFKSGFQPLGQRDQSHDETSRTSSTSWRQEAAAQNAPQLHVAESEVRIDPQFDPERPAIEALLRRNGVDPTTAALSKSIHNGKPQDSDSRVRIKYVSKFDVPAIDGIRREVVALTAIADVCVEKLIEWMEFESSMYIVLEHKTAISLRQQVKSKGTLAADTTRLKSVIVQLFAGVAAIFMAGFTHLRLTEETVCIDPESRIIIRDFQYAHPYSEEKTDDLYAAVDAKHGADIYNAPEVFASMKYNGRKASLWSCGVVIYFMTTGQTDKLSALSHPAFDSTLLHPSRRMTVTTNIMKPVPYPSRFDVPGWARDIISKLLITDPARRAELIEVASKVPKEIATKHTRPFMELIWLDYKSHVGPLAGTQQRSSFSSDASSIFSGVSNFSNPLGGLIGSRRKSSSKYTFA